MRDSWAQNSHLYRKQDPKSKKAGTKRKVLISQSCQKLQQKIKRAQKSRYIYFPKKWCYKGWQSSTKLSHIITRCRQRFLISRQLPWLPSRWPRNRSTITWLRWSWWNHFTYLSEGSSFPQNTREISRMRITRKSIQLWQPSATTSFINSKNQETQI